MLYHAILQLNQKAKQSAKQKKQTINLTHQKGHNKTKLAKKQTTTQTKKAKAQIITQTAFNKQNTINRRNDFKKLIN
jgi:hypothetical protein